MRAQSADLREPWQHSLNENTKCLFRQYFSKGTDFLSNSPAHLNYGARQLKERPYKTLEFESRQSGLTQVLHRPVEPASVKRPLRFHTCRAFERNRPARHRMVLEAVKFNIPGLREFCGIEIFRQPNF